VLLMSLHHGSSDVPLRYYLDTMQMLSVLCLILKSIIDDDYAVTATVAALSLPLTMVLRLLL
jgi:hypothetical protein